MSKTRLQVLIAAAITGWAVTLTGLLVLPNVNMSLVKRILLEPLFAFLTVLSHLRINISDNLVLNLFPLFVASFINMLAWAAMVCGFAVLVQHLRRSAASHSGIAH